MNKDEEPWDPAIDTMYDFLYDDLNSDPNSRVRVRVWKCPDNHWDMVVWCAGVASCTNPGCNRTSADVG